LLWKLADLDKDKEHCSERHVLLMSEARPMRMTANATMPSITGVVRMSLRADIVGKRIEIKEVWELC
jgi:hypothetical protein